MKSHVSRTINVLFAFSIIAFHVLMALNFILTVENPSEWITFRLSAPAAPAIDPLTTKSAAYQWRYSTLPDVCGLTAMIFLVFVCGYLAYLSWHKKPGWVITGIVLSVVGIIFMTHLYGAGLMQYALRQIPSAINQAGYPSLEHILERSPLWSISQVLSVFSIIGPILLMMGAYLSREMNAWVMILFSVGALLLFFFFDVRNLQLLGITMMLVSLFPTVLRLCMQKSFSPCRCLAEKPATGLY